MKNSLNTMNVLKSRFAIGLTFCLYCQITVLTSTSAQVGIDQAIGLANQPGVNPWRVDLSIADRRDRLLILTLHHEDDIASGGLDVIEGITYGGQPLTKIIDAGLATSSAANDNEVYALVAPPTGDHTILVEYDSTVNPWGTHMAVYSLFHAQQHLNFQHRKTSIPDDPAPLSHNFTSLVPGTLVLDMMACSGSGTIITPSHDMYRALDVRNYDGANSLGGYTFIDDTGSHLSSFSYNQADFRKSLITLLVYESYFPDDNQLRPVWTTVDSASVLPGGKVGINVDTVTSEHMLYVDGVIGAQSLKIEATDMPDYVFEESYPLQSLEDVDMYIQQRHHLPDIPSAAEFEANGMSLLEMNQLLLKKIEELTLHMIGMDSTIQHHQRASHQTQN